MRLGVPGHRVRGPTQMLEFGSVDVPPLERASAKKATQLLDKHSRASIDENLAIDGFGLGVFWTREKVPYSADAAKLTAWPLVSKNRHDRMWTWKGPKPSRNEGGDGLTGILMGMSLRRHGAIVAVLWAAWLGRARGRRASSKRQRVHSGPLDGRPPRRDAATGSSDCCEVRH